MADELAACCARCVHYVPSLTAEGTGWCELGTDVPGALPMALVVKVDTPACGRFVAVREDCGRVICAWCNKHLRFDADLPAGTVSHGICPDCRARWRTEWAADFGGAP